ncbi:MAG: hypothetical protein ACMG6S_24855 [Byssovorax sp.]
MKPALLALLFATATAPGIAGCGYTLANAPHDALGPFTVRAAEATTPDAAVTAAAIEGAQRELLRAGLLSARGEGTALTITLVRVDERSEGIARGADSAPIGRGIRLVIAGRALVRGQESAPARDSGEITVAEVFARSESAALGIVGRSEAAERAGRRLGERLVRRVLGEIDPGEP